MTQKQDEREARDRNIFALSRAGSSAKALAQQFGLTTARINAVIRMGRFYAECDAMNERMRQDRRRTQIENMRWEGELAARVHRLLALGMTAVEIGRGLGANPHEILEMVAPFRGEDAS